MAEETIKISDGASAKVVKGGANLSKEEHTEKLKEPERDTLVARVYAELLDFLKQCSARTKRDFDDVINSLLIDAVRMHKHNKCPYCFKFQEKNLKLQKDNYRLQNLVSKNIKKKKRKTQKEARKANR